MRVVSMGRALPSGSSGQGERAEPGSTVPGGAKGIAARAPGPGGEEAGEVPDDPSGLAVAQSMADSAVTPSSPQTHAHRPPPARAGAVDRGMLEKWAQSDAEVAAPWWVVGGGGGWLAVVVGWQWWLVGSDGWLVGGGGIPSHALHCRWSFDGTVVFVHQNPEIVTLTFLSFLPEPTVPVVRRTPPVGCCQPQPGRGAPVRAVLFSFLEFRGTKELWLFHPRLYCPTRRPKCPLRPRYFQSYLLTPCSLPFWGFPFPRPLHPPFLLGTLCAGSSHRFHLRCPRTTDSSGLSVAQSMVDSAATTSRPSSTAHRARFPSKATTSPTTKSSSARCERKPRGVV